MKLLIIHGPNMNLLGSFSKNRLTLDKLNRLIRQFAQKNDIDVKIYQTHNESKYINLLQRNRNKVDGMVLNLGPWHLDSNLINHTLSIIDIPYRIAESSEQSKEYLKKSLFNQSVMIENSDIHQSYISAMEQLMS